MKSDLRTDLDDLRCKIFGGAAQSPSPGGETAAGSG